MFKDNRSHVCTYIISKYVATFFAVLFGQGYLKIIYWAVYTIVSHIHEFTKTQINFQKMLLTLYIVAIFFLTLCALLVKKD